jgi:hypothetical protein
MFELAKSLNVTTKPILSTRTQGRAYSMFAEKSGISSVVELHAVI